MKANKTLALAMLCISTVGCNRFIEDATQSASSVGSNSSVPLSIKVGMQVRVDGVLKLDTSTSLNSSVSLKAGQVMKFDIVPQNAPVGSVVRLVVDNSWDMAAPILDKSSSSGSLSASVTAPNAGSYAITITVKAPNGQEGQVAYAADVACANPTFTANTLNASGISVGGAYAATTYNASSVVSGANGQAPYRCAYDFNGDEIVDSPLLPCGDTQTKLSTYVLSRKVNVIVADACNTSYSVSKQVILPKLDPTSDDEFIQADVTAGSGCADNIRVKGVSYLAMNRVPGGMTPPCDPKYGNGGFSIECHQNFGLPHSETFGMKLSVSGLGSYDIKTNPGVIDYSNAKVSGINYTTDEGGDSSPRVAFAGAGSNCVSTVEAKVVNVKNGTCTNGTSGTNNSATIQVSGTFTCSNVSNACGSATITGKFSGKYNLADGCSGGQGGPGDPPPSF